MNGKRSKLEELQWFLDGEADESTATCIEEELKDPNSDLAAFFEVCRFRAEHFEPTDIDWEQFFD